MDSFQDLTRMEVDVEVEDTPSTQQLTEFPLFSQLPTELRLKIWGFTRVPRLLEEKHCRKDKYLDEYGQPVSRPNYPLNIVLTVPALNVCRESRAELTSSYQSIAFTEEHCRRLWVSQEGDGSLKPKVLFNPDQDILHYDSLRSRSDSSLASLRSENALDWLYAQEERPWVIFFQFIKKIQVTPRVFIDQTSIDRGLGHNADFESQDPTEREPMLFTYFQFDRLEQFIVQDFDCKFPHQLDCEEQRYQWRRVLDDMFRNEVKYDNTRIGVDDGDYRIPELIIHPGKKIKSPCEDCVAARKQAKTRRIRGIRSDRV
ncbi:hypothetical protein SBOR_4090 [Sclerotinia borealis F-4128]|uniref:2EXR domain-containing protein n=1 Tax=Sclerotinia borealis (strain F-4128) TaxID=1432307 RepID=W9CLV7_SCLBF|nr:hypothetical protein SBOR_4090 [Sclerotinia borealis F-4128]